jgi:hypothetical protein
MTLQELLPLWAELAPDECTYGNDPNCSTDVDRPYYQVYRYDRLTWVGPRNADYREGFYTDVIQGAVQQAIEARGWDWTINSAHYTIYSYGAYVHRANGREYGEGTDPAIALLEAYVKALQSEVK